MALTALLVDASVWVTLLEDASPHREATAGLMRRHEQHLGALDLTLYEIANAVGVKQGNPEMARQLARLVVTRCGERLVSVERDLVDAALDVASDHGLTAYDAAYVAAARRQGWTLVSTDIADLVSKGLAVTPDAADYP